MKCCYSFRLLDSRFLVYNTRVAHAFITKVLGTSDEWRIKVGGSVRNVT